MREIASARRANGDCSARRLLQNVSNGHIRFWIPSQAKVLAVVSIPQEAFIPYGTGIKTSLLILQKLPANAEAFSWHGLATWI